MLSCAVILTGCWRTTATGATDLDLGQPEPVQSSVCLVVKPIYWSARDTPETIAEIKAHNHVWDALCRPDKAAR